MQVGIVNDLRLIAEALRRIVADTPGFTVAWVAHNGSAAIEHHRTRPADIVLMDLIMPGLDGAQTTEAIMKLHPCAILVVTATVTGNRDLVYAAMNKGALDAVNTPDATSEHSVAELRRKLTTVSRLVAGHTKQAPLQPATPFARPAAGTLQRAIPSTGDRTPAGTPAGTPAIIGIGASTGGPQAIATILRGLPKDFNAAVVIVQHLDRQFVPGLERWLQRESNLPVHLATNDEPLHRGAVWLADSDHHLIIRNSAGSSPTISGISHNSSSSAGSSSSADSSSNASSSSAGSSSKADSSSAGSSSNASRTIANSTLRLQYTDQPADAPNRPSVDVFFESLAQLRGIHRCGVLLTGMGSDGAAGLMALHTAGATTFAQDAESCVVYGMPAVALKLGAITHSTKLADISTRLLEFAGQTSPHQLPTKP